MPSMPLLYLYLHQVCSDVSPSTNPEDTLLFTSAALSVLNVGSKKTSSGVLINQLMAFAAVSGSIMSPDLVIGNLCRSPGAVLQLESVRQVWRDANAILPHTQTEHPGRATSITITVVVEGLLSSGVLDADPLDEDVKVAVPGGLTLVTSPPSS